MQEVEVESGLLGDHAEVLPEIRVPPAVLVGSPSRFTNIYAPVPESIYLPQEILAPEKTIIRVTRGQTRSLRDYRPEGRRAAIRTAIETVRDGPVADLGSRLVYDARFEDNSNVAHLLGFHVAHLGYIKSHLGIDGDALTVILEKNAPQIAHDLIRWIGYETYETNRPVTGTVVEVLINPLINYHLVPYVHVMEPPGVQASSIEKLFISRRSGRRLTNEGDIISVTSNAGYETVYFEDLTLNEQWAAIRDAKSIVSIHGAALGYLSGKWRREGTPPFDFLEIYSPGLVADCYRKITAVLGGYWVGCRGHVSSNFVAGVEESTELRGMIQGDFHLDPGALELALEYLQERPDSLSLRP